MPKNKRTKRRNKKINNRKKKSKMEKQIKKSSSYYSKFIIKTIPDYEIKEVHQKYDIKNVGENEYEIYIQYEQEDNILYDQLRFDKKIISFEKNLKNLKKRLKCYKHIK